MSPAGIAWLTAEAKSAVREVKGYVLRNDPENAEIFGAMAAHYGFQVLRSLMPGLVGVNPCIRCLDLAAKLGANGMVR